MADTRSSSMIRRTGDRAGGVDGLYHAMCSITQSYGEAIDQALVGLGAEATKRLVKRTIESAPIGSRLVKRKFDAGRPHLFESISAMRVKTVKGLPAHLWYVRAPNSRIAHLVEHGYWRADTGSGYSGSHFLRRAVEIETERYYREVEDYLASLGYRVQMKYAGSFNTNFKHTLVKMDGS